jgi:hypothetical protein
MIEEEMVYSESDQPLNIKPREVYCVICDYMVVTALPGPKCKGCHNSMISTLSEPGERNIPDE